MKRTVILLVGLTVFLAACGSSTSTEPGPAADADKTPAQIEEQVAEADTETLQSALEGYKAALAEKRSELKALEEDLGAQLEKSAGDLVDLLGGDAAKQEELGADYEAMKERVKILEADIDGLKTRMKIYADELATR